MARLPLESWNRPLSPLDQLDARTKLITLILLLAAVATTSKWCLAAPGFFFGCAVFLIVISGAPLPRLLLRAAVVLPFAVTFAAISAFTGDWVKAWSLLGKSFISACIVLAVAVSTPAHRLLAAAHQLGAPRLVVTVAQFLYRYLFLLVEKGQRVRLAALMRGGFRWDSAGGAVAALFGSAYSHAEGVHRAMLARGYTGQLPQPLSGAWRGRDSLVIAVIVLVLSVVRLLWLR